MKRRGLVALLFLIVSGCGLALPDVEPVSRPLPEIDDPPEIVEPPELVINGEAGKPVTWCWGNACVDGFLNDPSLAPAVAAPFEVLLPAGSRIEGVSAIGPGAPGRQESVEVPFEGTDIGDVPEGAVMLNVFVRFADGGDASYFWALNRPPDTP